MREQAGTAIDNCRLSLGCYCVLPLPSISPMLNSPILSPPISTCRQHNGAVSELRSLVSMVTSMKARFATLWEMFVLYWALLLVDI